MHRHSRDFSLRPPSVPTPVGAEIGKNRAK
jgi:hypothetical protein